MKIFNWQVVLGIVLIVASALVYTLHFVLFRDAHHIFVFLVSDIAFVFIEVLLVTMILHRLLEVREKKKKLQKLNMVIGTFFSELGRDLLEQLSGFDQEAEQTRSHLLIDQNWSAAKFPQTQKTMLTRSYHTDARTANLEDLKKLFADKNDHILRILENPTMLEHDSFTDMLWAIFHLGDELAHRKDLQNISEADLDHLSLDIGRAYSRLIVEWLAYMKHLQEDYPYLFSLACRLNPFDPDAKAEIV